MLVWCSCLFKPLRALHMARCGKFVKPMLSIIDSGTRMDLLLLACVVSQTTDATRDGTRVSSRATHLDWHTSADSSFLCMSVVPFLELS